MLVGALSLVSAALHGGPAPDRLFYAAFALAVLAGAWLRAAGALRPGRRNASAAPRFLVVHPDGRFSLLRGTAGEPEGEGWVLPGGWIGPWVCELCLDAGVDRIRVLVWRADQVEGDFRRLRVWLRHRTEAEPEG